MYEQSHPVPRPVPRHSHTIDAPIDRSEPLQPDPRAGVDDALSSLDGLDRLPLSEHVERFDAVHTELTVALSSIDKV